MTRARVYTCFDARGSKNPAETDLKYYFLLRAWSERAPLANTFLDVHRAAPAATASDLGRELGVRLKSSDVLLLILSERTRKSEGWLSWEIDFALDVCRLPLVCAYTPRVESLGCASPRAWWPAALRRARREPLAVTQIPFRPGALASAFASLSRPSEVAGATSQRPRVA